MRTWFAMGLLAFSSPVHAALDEAFCSDLSRMVAAAGERPPFASLADRPPALGLAASCHPGDPVLPPVYSCRRLERNEGVTRRALTDAVRQCIPQASLVADAPLRLSSAETRFRLGRLTIWILEYAPHTRMGHQISLGVTPDE